MAPRPITWFLSVYGHDTSQLDGIVSSVNIQYQNLSISAHQDIRTPLAHIHLYVVGL